MNTNTKAANFLLAMIIIPAFLLVSCTHEMPSVPIYAKLLESFKIPPDSARPGVYWYFLDGNLSHEEMTADLESMKEIGIGNLVFLEVNVGVHRSC